MDVKKLAQIPSWEWPKEARAILLEVLRRADAPTSDRALAANLAGDLVAMNDEVAGVLLSILENAGEADEVRGSAAIALGPVLEDGDTQGFDELEVVSIAEETYRRVRQALRALFDATHVPDEVRRRVLEASVRAPERWHPEAVRTAWASADKAWKTTALFGMGFLPGFEEQILSALDGPDADLRYEAIVAAGRRAVDAAWPHIERIVASGPADKDLLLAAIDAAPGIRPEDTPALLEDLEDSPDQDIAAAVEEAISMAQAMSAEVYDDEEDDEGE
jgi:hypothetical protein